MASYAGATSGVTVNLGTVAGQDTFGDGTDTLVNIESLTGSAFADQLTGNAGANTLTGNAGNDVLDGGAGADTMIGGAATDTLRRRQCRRPRHGERERRHRRSSMRR